MVACRGGDLAKAMLGVSIELATTTSSGVVLLVGGVVVGSPYYAASHEVSPGENPSSSLLEWATTTPWISLPCWRCCLGVSFSFESIDVARNGKDDLFSVVMIVMLGVVSTTVPLCEALS